MKTTHKIWQAPSGACLSHETARTDGRRDRLTMDTEKALRLDGKKVPPFGVMGISKFKQRWRRQRKSHQTK